MAFHKIKMHATQPSGWPQEPMRHSLAAKGISTGRKDRLSSIESKLDVLIEKDKAVHTQLEGQTTPTQPVDPIPAPGVVVDNVDPEIERLRHKKELLDAKNDLRDEQSRSDRNDFADEWFPY